MAVAQASGQTWIVGRKSRVKELDPCEAFAKACLEPLLGPLAQRDLGGGATAEPDFTAELPGGHIAVVEVTSNIVQEEQRLDAATVRHLSEMRLPGSRRGWLVAPGPDANIIDLKNGALVRLLTDIEAAGRDHVHSRDDYRDALSSSCGISRSNWSTPGQHSTTRGRYWSAAARSPVGVGAAQVRGAWLEDFLASEQGAGKLEKLGRTDAAERHLVIMLDARSGPGLGIPTGLTDWDDPLARMPLVPTLTPPPPLTHLWLIPLVGGWLGLGWSLRSGWALFDKPSLRPQSV